MNRYVNFRELTSDISELMKLISDEILSRESNSIPKDFIEVTEAEIIDKTFFGRELPVAMDYRQCKVDGIWLTLTCYLYKDNTGVAHCANLANKKFRWFRFGCKHSFTIKEISRNYHEYSCKICGHKENIDSGD